MFVELNKEERRFPIQIQFNDKNLKNRNVCEKKGPPHLDERGKTIFF